MFDIIEPATSKFKTKYPKIQNPTPYFVGTLAAEPGAGVGQRAPQHGAGVRRRCAKGSSRTRQVAPAADVEC